MQSNLRARWKSCSCGGLRAAGDTAALRELLAATVQSARIVERRRGSKNGRTGWLRPEVTWTSLVARFLQKGYLVLDPAPQAPSAPAPATGAGRTRRWRELHPQGPEQLPDGLMSVADAARALGVSDDTVRGAIRRGTLARSLHVALGGPAGTSSALSYLVPRP